jgi:hypothetical protein
MSEHVATDHSNVEEQYDFSDIPPPCHEGEFTATPKAKLATSKSDSKFPMIKIEWKVKSAAAADGQIDVGKKLQDNLIFAPKTDPWAHLHMGRVQSCLSHLGVSLKGSREQICAEINAVGEVTIWVSHEINKDTGEIQARVGYKAPRGSRGASKPEATEEENPRRNGKARK